MKNEETQIDEVTMTEMFTNIFHHEEKMQTYMEPSRWPYWEKDSLIKQLIAENKQQRETLINV